MNAEIPSRDSILRQLRRAHRDWPTFLKDSAPAVEKAFFALSEAERNEAVECAQAFILACKRPPKQQVCGFSKYLSEKRWLKLAEIGIEVSVEQAKPMVAKPRGKAWMAIRLCELHKPMVPETAWPPAPSYVSKRIAEGGHVGERERMARRERYGWPKVHDLNVKFAEGRPVLASPEMIAIGTDFVSVDLAGAVGQAWFQLHERLQLPWLPGVGNYAYFPPVDASSDDLDAAVEAAFWGLRERIEGRVQDAAQ